MDHALQIGYVKSSAASAMRGEQTAIVGLLLPNIINEFYARFANAFGSLCAEAGFDLVIHLTEDNYEREAKSLLRLQALQARAVIRVPAPMSSQKQAITNTAIPTINLIRTRENEESIGSLLIDDGLAIESAVHFLFKKGRRRIAYIGASEALSSGRDRLNAFTRSLNNVGGTLHEDLVCTGAPSYQMGQDFMNSLLDLPEAPDSLVCGGFEISNGALDACLTNHVKIPECLEFVGYGDPSFYRWIAGGISTISISEQQVALHALEMVKAVDIRQEDKNKIIPTELILRGD